MAVIKEDNGDAGADAQTLYTMSLGDVFQGTLDPADDKDLLKVELSAETIYDFTLSGVDSAELALFDSSGNRIVSGNYTPSGTKLVFSPSVSGTFYIGVGSYDDSLTGDYELSLVENTSPVGTYDELADYLIDGFYEQRGGWGSTRSFNVRAGGTLTVNTTALTEAGQQLARWALEAWSNVTAIKFQFVDHDNADITFDNHEADYASGYFLVNNGIVSGYVNNPESFLIKHGATIDSYNFLGHLHELGHALGLGHVGPYSGRPFSYGHHNLFVNDSQQLSTMSYVEQDENTYLNASLAVPVTPMIADIIAIQKLYGVPDTINTGDTIYGYQSNLDGYLGEFFRLWSGEANPFFSVEVASNLEYQALKPALTDLDNDGDPDLVVGNNTGLLYYFENTGTSANPEFTERAGTANPLDGLSVGSYSAPTFIDLDGDSDIDLIVGDGHGNIAYFENTGTATTPGFTQRSGAENPFANITMGPWSTLAFADLDGDGDSDLAVGTNDGDVPYYENTGTSANPEFTLRAGASSPTSNVNAGSYNTPAFIDVDGDNDFDLVVGNNHGDILYFENTGTTTEPGFTPRTDFDNPFHATVAGFWIGLEFADLNGDGRPDLIVGNDEGIIHYFESVGTPENPEFSPQSLAIPTAFTIYDNGGNDTLDLRTDTQDQRVYLRPEGISDVYGLIGNMIIARDTWIENYIAGSGDDFIAGNAVANDLNGRDGNDRIWGGGGDDILEGGAGADRLDGDAGMDWAAYRDSDAAVTINLAEGMVQGGHAEGDVLTGIENVIGSAHDDVLVGNDDANRLEGGAGADRLDGGAGLDWASYRGSNEGVSVDLADGTAEGGHAQGDVITNLENLSGSGFADVLRGDSNANSLDGEGGNDRLWGAGGDDVLAGGHGDDWLLGSKGADQLDGGAGSDVLSYELSAAGVTVNLGDGVLTGGYAQGDVITGIEHVMGSGYRDVLTGDSGPNELYGIGGDDELRGNGGDDVLQGGAGDDRLRGGGGDDVLEGGAGGDRLDGGAGTDWVSYAGSDGAVSVRLYDGYTGRGHADGDVISGFENLRGSAYADALAGDGGANRLEGGAGDDRLRGGGGDDVLEGGAGGDRLDGGAGTDWLSYAGSDGAVSVRLYDGYTRRGHADGDVISGFENIAGSAYPDVLTGDDGPNELAGNGGDDELRGNGGDDVLAGGAGADRLDGGAGRDTLSYSSSDAGVQVNLAAGTAEGGYAEGDTFNGIENLTGSDYRDILTGDVGANRLDGAEGDDVLHGGGGADRLVGNMGDDDLHGAEGGDDLRGNVGNDRLFGESGTDVLYGDEGDDELHGGTDGDQLFGGIGADSLYGDEGDDDLQGGDGNDRLSGNAGADRLDGGRGIDWASYLGSDAGVRINLASGTAGGGDAEGDVLTAIENLEGSGYDDELRGDGLANVLYGLAGADELYGNGGDDVLQGGAGADRLDGGSGIDTLSYQDSDAGVTVSLVDSTTEGGHAQGDVTRSIENVIGSDYEDAIRGDDGANHLIGGAGDDRLHGGAGADLLDGGTGTDLIEYWSSDAGVTVNLKEGTAEGGHAEGDVIVDVERVWGSRYRDILVGDDGDNLLDGHHGEDDLQGEGGDDWMIGSPGADKLDGGEGSDGVSYWHSDTGVTVNLEDGTGEGGHAEGDVIVNIERIEGSGHGDVLTGDDDHNYLYGLAGADRIIGGAGNDRLYGNAYNLDQEDRSGSVDVFVFDVGHGNDAIYDFVDNEDKIDLSAFGLSGFDDLVLSSDFFGVTTVDLSAYGGGTIKLFEFDIASLDATDFLFYT